jgi:hypothetical protein
MGRVVGIGRRYGLEGKADSESQAFIDLRHLNVCSSSECAAVTKLQDRFTSN